MVQWGERWLPQCGQCMGGAKASQWVGGAREGEGGRCTGRDEVGPVVVELRAAPPQCEWLLASVGGMPQTVSGRLWCAQLVAGHPLVGVDPQPMQGATP